MSGDIKPPEGWTFLYDFVKEQYPNGFTSNELRILRVMFKKAYDQDTHKKKKFISSYSRKGGWGSYH
jgi:hypothetical protein